MRELIVKRSDQGKTLQTLLRGIFPFALVEKIFRKNGVRVNGERGKPERILKQGDKLTFYIPLQVEAPAAKKVNVKPYEVLLENDDFLVINKMAGVTVHEGKTVGLKESLIGQLRDAYRGKGIRPDLVHRLDSQTSGCLIVVKREELVAPFEAMFKKGEVEKVYLVLVMGRLDSQRGSIDSPLPGREGNLVGALTSYEVVQTFAKGDVTLVRARIKTGRKHQIRLHFAKLGHPVVMDSIHGDFDFNRTFKKSFGLKRQFLHAQELSFSWQGETVEVNAPLPSDLQETLQQLKTGESARWNVRH